MPLAVCLSRFDPEFVDALRGMAEAEADAVGKFLNALRGQFPDLFPESFSYPREFLTALGISFRFTTWERCNISVHLDAGLLSGVDLLSRTFDLIHGPELCEIVRRHAITSLRLFETHFLWTAAAEPFQTQLAIDGTLEDADLELIADFIWQHRHD